jgi:hypothetical protein
MPADATNAIAALLPARARGSTRLSCRARIDEFEQQLERFHDFCGAGF